MPIEATRTRIPDLPLQNLSGFHATDADGRLYYGKNQRCQKTGATNPAWIANELIYYVIAKRSGLKMPFGTVLDLSGTLCWGSEYLPGRISIHKMGGPNGKLTDPLLREACDGSPGELRGLAKALLLDVALLNSDRQPWNILGSRTSGGLELFFCDHDKSLIGDGQEPNRGGDLGRISIPAVTDEKLGDYLKCETANDIVLGGLSDADFVDLFLELDLNDASLAAARTKCPVGWMSDDIYDRLCSFLREWWRHVHEGLEEKGAQQFLGSRCVRHRI